MIEVFFSSVVGDNQLLKLGAELSAIRGLFCSRLPNAREKRPLLEGNGQKNFSCEITKLLWQHFLHLMAEMASRFKGATDEEVMAFK